MKKNVIILRGVSSSGKSTVAKLFGYDPVICTADDFFYDGDDYKFDPRFLGAAHEQCFQKFLFALDDDKIETIVVANTNTKESDFQEYIDEARKRDIMVFSLVVEKRHSGQNDHDVPEKTIRKQEQRIKSNLKLT